MLQRSPEWFEARVGRITASRVGAILGCNPWRGYGAVMREMLDEARGVHVYTSNQAMDWGTFHEAGAIAEYEMETGHVVTPASFVELGSSYGASPDGYVLDGIIEIKCPFKARDYTSRDQFMSAAEQLHYWHQMQMQMHVCEVYWCDFYQWAPGASRLETVQYEPGWWDQVEPALSAFLEEFKHELTR
jgi:putative phage-type endonuclease